MTERTPTTELLAEALIAAKAPQTMIQLARSGYYDDYLSELAMPIVQLVRDATKHGLSTIAGQANRGEFDAQPWEAEEWEKSPEGQAFFNEFLGMKKL